MTSLVWVEHDGAVLKDATLSTVTAAAQLGEVVALVAGQGCGAVAAAAAKVAGVSRVLLAEDAAYAHGLADNIAPLVAGLMEGFDAFVAPATTGGKNIAPRVAALLDVMQVSEILSVEGPRTFTRPIYAGNLIATVESRDAKLVLTVRATAFAKADATGGSATVESIAGPGDAGSRPLSRRRLPAMSAPNSPAPRWWFREDARSRMRRASRR
jgi:electron transfer flavoprotein alpha subunit